MTFVIATIIKTVTILFIYGNNWRDLSVLPRIELCIFTKLIAAYNKDKM